MRANERLFQLIRKGLHLMLPDDPPITTFQQTNIRNKCYRLVIDLVVARIILPLGGHLPLVSC